MKTIGAKSLALRLRSEEELALLDVRDQEDALRERLLLSVGIAYDRLDVEVHRFVPRRSVPVVVVGDGAGLDALAYQRLVDQGYTDVAILSGGIAAWRAAGLPLYEDVNVASKVFGELVEHAYRTPNIGAQDLHAVLESEPETVVLLDCRPEAEHRHAHIPGALHVPGGDLYSAIRDLAPSAAQQVVVHCGGRTRGIIAAQGLITLGVPNPVSVLTDGVFGWHLAGLPLERGLNAPGPCRSDVARAWAEAAARKLAERADVRLMDAAGFDRWRVDAQRRTLLCFDLRPRSNGIAPDPTFPTVPHAAAGQLIQATDAYIGVRNCRIVLIDEDIARAVMTALWLRQMGWREVAVLPLADARAMGLGDAPPASGVAHPNALDCEQVFDRLGRGSLTVCDVSQSHRYVAGHIPQAAFIPRRHLVEKARSSDLGDLGDAPMVVACEDGRVSAEAVRELAPLVTMDVAYMEGGMQAWRSAELPTESGAGRILGCTSWLNEAFVEAVGEQGQLLRDYVDWELERYFDPRRESRVEEAMQGYLDWEIELYERWARDRGMPFEPLTPAG